MSEPASKRMTVPEFLDWVETRSSGKYELVRGEIVAMAPERVEHGRTKAKVWRALADSITRAGLPCEAFVDSIGVAIDETTIYEPDALVDCGATLAPDAFFAGSPCVIVEVISPASRRIDTNAKLSDYFRLTCVAHYLVVDCARRLVLHYCRNGARIEVAVVTEGVVTMSPPGLSLAIADIFD
jgi:Uma2 family endonuclease